MQQIIVNVDSPADLIAGYGAGALIRVERDTTSAMSTASEITTIPIVAGTTQYEYWDATGSLSHYYRTRYSKASPSLATDYSDYSDVFRAGQRLAYATREDLLETMHTAGEREYNLLSDLLVDASDDITDMCGRSFFRSPQVSGTEVRTYQIAHSGKNTLSDALGFDLDYISLTTVEVADSLTGTYTAVSAGATGYYTDPLYPATDWPYEDLRLSPDGSSYTTYPTGGLIRLTGAFGWAKVPPLVKRATVDLAREWYRQGPGGGGPIGVSALGQPTFSSGKPSTWWRLSKSDYRRRSFRHV